MAINTKLPGLNIGAKKVDLVRFRKKTANILQQVQPGLYFCSTLLCTEPNAIAYACGLTAVSIHSLVGVPVPRRLNLLSGYGET